MANAMIQHRRGNTDPICYHATIDPRRANKTERLERSITKTCPCIIQRFLVLKLDVMFDIFNKLFQNISLNTVDTESSV